MFFKDINDFAETLTTFAKIIIFVYFESTITNIYAGLFYLLVCPKSATIFVHNLQDQASMNQTFTLIDEKIRGRCRFCPNCVAFIYMVFFSGSSGTLPLPIKRNTASNQ